MADYLIQNLIQSPYDGLPIPILSTPNPHLSDFISKYSIISTQAPLMVFEHKISPL